MRPPLIRDRRLRDRLPTPSQKMQREPTLRIRARRRSRLAAARRMVVFYAARDVGEEVGGDEEGVEDAAAAVEADEGELVG